MKEDSIKITPIGIVKSEIEDTKVMPLGGIAAQIEVFPEFSEALECIEESSHLWILSWFNEAPRDLMKVVPKKVDPLSKEFGVFAIRCPARPNPIALTLVKLEKVEEKVLYVTGLDAVNGTKVLDIKPYFKNDIVLSHYGPNIGHRNDSALEGKVK
ncbi:tRNA (N6-threonylcarbamoyladenosine(37)-N6)-methyltransferase TrmO [Clostridium scatologenes]|uniref:TsaA-like domain-containing protein n=1 Tax=Clostridium scatologenes TaxID=1548 RepID=A0A0E3GQS9_CLOSL|nr:tRNA (N6-threonylcarbamoyladenosine(37)-N6)-methyltransferase TrmO [Clostridium scatologenes]AKA69101.1 hypothetical protein CSCA_1976 [Clostridium scatologenes]